jgi:ArsR family transcriptional regulator
MYNDGAILDIIGNNTRRKILATLAREPMYFNQLAKEIGVGQQAILRHMKALEDIELVASYSERSNLGAPDRKYYRLNSSFSLTISILTQSDDGQALKQLQANLTNIEKKISALDSRLNDLRALKQLIVRRLHRIAKDNFEEEFERKILHTIIEEAPQSISELANKLNEKPSRIRNTLHSMNKKLYGKEYAQKILFA